MAKAPNHIAIIMDGNGRWAKKRNMPRGMGHRKGAETVRMVVRECARMGVSHLTLYAFSQENWKRPKAEISILMKLLNQFLESELKTLKEEGVRFLTIGHTEALSEKIQDKIETMKQATADNKRLTLVVALNYGGRQEVLDGVRRFIDDLDQSNGASQHKLSKLTEATFAQYLDTAGMPDPDLLIRTSGEMRLSNFLLWQCSYSEIYISEKMWPEFTADDLIQAVRVFGERQRRFGAIA